MSRRSAPLRHRLFLCLVFVTAAAFIWPWYASVDHALPLIVGLPRPFAWLIIWVLVLFAGLLVVYMLDRRAHTRLDRRGGK
jgi:hypothetical protein